MYRRFTVAVVVLIGFLFFRNSRAHPPRTGLVPFPVNREIANPSAEKTLAPYFFVTDGDHTLDALPLKRTEADVSIAGPIASVTIKQTYKNEGKRAIEAIYTFPASTRAAVNGMKMTIGQRVLVAKIEERKKAREQYETAKKEGKNASLLEQQRPNVFQMNVANIMPGDVIEVELTYTEMLVPEQAMYEFVFPAVVGPRYSNVSEESAANQDKFVKNPYLQEGEKSPYEFRIKTSIKGGMPIDAIACDSHKVEVAYQGKDSALVTLANVPDNGGNRDFVLRYRLAGSQVQTGLMLFPGKKENFFSLIVEPPARPKLVEIPPREYIFVVDVSGSMNGFPLDTSKTLLRDLISKLRPTDKFNVLLFAAGTKLLSERSLPATPNQVEGAITFLESQRGSGGTELLPAIKKAFAIPRVEDVSRTLVLATDGYVSAEKEAFELVKSSLGQSNFFVFGIGKSVNRFLLEGLARAGRGEPFVVLDASEAAARATRFREYIEKPVLTGIKLRFDGTEISDVVPASYPDVFAERPLVVFGKYKEAKGSVTVSGRAGKQEFAKTMSFSKSFESPEHAPLAYLWARHRIAELADLVHIEADSSLQQEVTKLGLEYSLATDYTSFVAVDTIVRNVDGKAQTVVQPLPLPAGVSGLSVQRQGGSLFRFGRGMGGAGGGISLDSGMGMGSSARRKSLRLGGIIRGEVSSPAEQVVIETSGGALSREEIESVIRANLAKIKACYERNLQAKRGLAGRVMTRFTIQQSGRVSWASVLKSDLRHGPTESCITNEIRRWRFPLPRGGGSVRVTYPFQFAPVQP
jgi:Ca-activated chloride channel family protein